METQRTKQLEKLFHASKNKTKNLIKSINAGNLEYFAPSCLDRLEDEINNYFGKMIDLNEEYTAISGNPHPDCSKSIKNLDLVLKKIMNYSVFGDIVSLYSQHEGLN